MYLLEAHLLSQWMLYIWQWLAFNSPPHEWCWSNSSSSRNDSCLESDILGILLLFFFFQTWKKSGNLSPIKDLKNNKQTKKKPLQRPSSTLHFSDSWVSLLLINRRNLWRMRWMDWTPAAGKTHFTACRSQTFKNPLKDHSSSLIYSSCCVIVKTIVKMKGCQ